MHVNGLNELIASCGRSGDVASDVVFEQGRTVASNQDVFANLSSELIQMLTTYLDRRDVGNLRLVSSSFRQLPQIYFRRLVETEMPWLWELATVDTRKLDWYTLWCKLFAADGGSYLDVKEREWLHRIPDEHRARMTDDVGPSNTEERRARWAKVQKEIEAELKAGYEAGMWPRSNEDGVALKGLRNRRRIWNDLEEILRRIAALPVDDEVDSWSDIVQDEEALALRQLLGVRRD